jgi:hypothetical protein
MESKTFEVEMLAYGGGDIRPVDVPIEELKGRTEAEILEVVFYYGQNDFQPKPFPSVSVGDVIRFDGKRFFVSCVGFEVL